MSSVVVLFVDALLISTVDNSKNFLSKVVTSSETFKFLSLILSTLLFDSLGLGVKILVI
jgi:hypothetical protein